MTESNKKKFIITDIKSGKSYKVIIIDHLEIDGRRYSVCKDAAKESYYFLEIIDECGNYVFISEKEKEKVQEVWSA